MQPKACTVVRNLIENKGLEKVQPACQLDEALHATGVLGARRLLQVILSNA